MAQEITSIEIREMIDKAYRLWMLAGSKDEAQLCAEIHQKLTQLLSGKK